MKWCKKIEELNNRRGKRPEGKEWFTFKELYEKFPYGDNKLRRILNKGMDEGTVEIFEGSEMRDRGTLNRQVWYRFKE